MSMRFAVSSRISKDFKEFVSGLKKNGINTIELHHKDVKETKFRGIKVVSIHGMLRDYKYLIFLAEALGVEYICFNAYKGEMRKVLRASEEAKEHDVRIAIENNDEFRTPQDVYYALSDNELGFVLNTSNARKYNRSLTGFVKMLRDRIVGVHLSDWYKGIPNLPYSLGESDFLDPVIKELKNVPIVLDMDERYSIEDAVISMNKLKERERKLRYQ